MSYVTRGMLLHCATCETQWLVHTKDIDDKCFFCGELGVEGSLPDNTRQIFEPLP
jgi:hypothetical protein